MAEVQYNHDAKVSEIEFIVIQKIRSLLDKNNGTLEVLVRDGRVTAIDLMFRHDTKELARLQQ